MSISLATSSLIWSRSRGLCNLCRIDLAPLIGIQATSTGFRAHITADNKGGPRYDETLNDAQRNDYSNLMLLCGDCHTKVDKRPDHYTVALLHFLKEQHERECLERLTISDERRAIRGEILASAADLVIQWLSLETWDDWTANILGPSPFRWPKYAFKEFYQGFRPQVRSILWPNDARSLMLASMMAADAIAALKSTFSEKSYPESNEFVCDSIEMMLDQYMGTEPEHEYELYLSRWDDILTLGLVHLAKCVNWIGDGIREHVDPRFRITKGAFRIEPTQFDGDEFRYGVHNFSDAEKSRILSQGYPHIQFHDATMLVSTTWDAIPISRYHAW